MTNTLLLKKGLVLLIRLIIVFIFLYIAIYIKIYDIYIQYKL